MTGWCLPYWRQISFLTKLGWSSRPEVALWVGSGDSVVRGSGLRIGQLWVWIPVPANRHSMSDQFNSSDKKKKASAKMHNCNAVYITNLFNSCTSGWYDHSGGFWDLGFCPGYLCRSSAPCWWLGSLSGANNNTSKTTIVETIRKNYWEIFNITYRV